MNIIEMNKIFKIKKLRFNIGVILGSISLFLNMFLLGEIRNGIIFLILFVGVGILSIKECDFTEKTLNILYVLWFIISAFAIFFLSQLIISAGIFSMGALRLFLNLGIYLMLFVIFFMITLKPVLSVNIVAISMIFLSIANYFVFNFRGTELQPIDLLSIGTAKNVAAEYNFSITPQILYGSILLVLYLFFSFTLPKIRVKHRGKARVRLFGIMLIVFTILLMNVKICSINPFFWRQEGSKMNGYLLNFVLQFQNTFIAKPKGYSLEFIEKTADKYKNEGLEEIANIEKDKPDVIVIMDESFADFRVLGSEINTNQPITPFIDSMQENTIRGYALSSVFGGTTPNSEYEVLSGNSLFFLPPGTVVYSQYLKEPSYSMVSEMKNNGYKCISLHPFMPNGWERPKVYPQLGFDESYFIDDFPQEDIIREFVSDKEMFEQIIELYEENKKQEKEVFMFGVTMQNHGGYEYSGKNFEQTIELKGYKKDYDQVEQYLSLIHETDKAVEFLVDYFKNVDNEVMLVFYGDHFPNLDRDFYEELHGGEFENIDQQQLMYKVPFFIWTNYDIEEKQEELTSLNYLSNYIFEISGLQIPEYNRVLRDIQKEIPALNANGYYSKEQEKFSSYNEATGKEAEMLYIYNQLQYNSLFDRKNRNNILFPLVTE